MAIFEWNDRLSVGIESIDAQHRTLVSLLNQLGEALRQVRGMEAAAPILNNLLAFSITHFAHEERLMAEHEFPGLDEHLRLHDALKAEAVTLQARARAGDDVVNADTLTVLERWLVQHITGSDRDAAAFLLRQGAR